MRPKKVFVSGCFDMLHSGHVRFLEEAANETIEPPASITRTGNSPRLQRLSADHRNAAQ